MIKQHNDSQGHYAQYKRQQTTIFVGADIFARQPDVQIDSLFMCIRSLSRRIGAQGQPSLMLFF